MSEIANFTSPSVPFTQSGSSPPSCETSSVSSPTGAGESTRAIHAGQRPDPSSGSILTPIHQTATYAQRGILDTISEDGHTYSRCSNPTVTALEQNLAGLEGVPHALAFKTGLAAISALLLTVLRQGDHVVAGEVIYGGSVRLLRDVLGKFGVETSFVDATDPGAVEAAIRENTRLLFVETPANPTLRVCDLGALGEIASRHDVLYAVDNTFLTCCLQPVFEHGADISILSTTKYVEGHDSTTGGALLLRDSALYDELFVTRSALGSIQAPFDAWLTLRGLKTLPLRIQRHSDSALTIAQRLEAHPAIERVHYPFLSSFPEYDLAQRQQRSGGGMLAFELDPAWVRPFLAELQITTLAENLGAAETLITHPATMTHSQILPEKRQQLGITDGLLRLSVGLEDAEDLWKDIACALESACRVEVSA